MKITKRTLLIWITILVMVGLWYWRYTTLNEYYSGINTVTEMVYQADEIVPFENDRISDGTVLDGYSIRVDDFEIIDIHSFCAVYGVNYDDLYSKPDQVALVYVTFFNEASKAEGIALTDFLLHGIDNYVSSNWELLSLLNPVLQGRYGIRLPENSEYQVVLPFSIYQTYFGSSTWDEMDKYDWFLRITYWPTEKDIAVN